MPVISKNQTSASYTGLQESEVILLRQKFGKNIFSAEKQRRFRHVLKDVFVEPMFILLAIAAAIYFILGETNEGLLMVLAMGFVAAISIYQDVKSTKALKALQQFTQPKVIVVRNGIEQLAAAGDLVPGDIMLCEEGSRIAADAIIIEANDCTVNESILTGESLPAEKTAEEGKNILYQGTLINSGKCVAEITATGNNTVLGKLGKSISGYAAPKTLLQQQIGVFVKKLALFGVIAFLAIWVVNYFRSGSVAESLLFALTLAMASIPEEIPVAFSSFMALGALHMSKLGIITRQPQTIENLGAVSVICLDKTGTITENKMEVKEIYDYANDILIDTSSAEILPGLEVVYYAMLASEQHPFDAMEKAIAEAWEKFSAGEDTAALSMVFEYPLEGKPPMMTHVYESASGKTIAAKGAAERILRVCEIPGEKKEWIYSLAKSIASKGYRIIAVAKAINHTGDLPGEQDNFNWQFLGFIGLYDPPKKNIAETFQQFYNAGLTIKLLTGDYAETAANIASQAGLQGSLFSISGDEVMNMTAEELHKTVKHTNIFARMFPEAKLKVIDALKEQGEIVAMTGDGVNDAPALKSASIGIAMGERGTEIARQSADLILTDDDASKIVMAIREGRKIFSNLKKAIRYIISIHIPILLTASLPVVFGWTYPNIFTPIHIIFLELIMGPTCSVFFEREPVEASIMQLPPRKRTAGLYTGDELFLSIVQGLIITLGILGLYYYFMHASYPIAFVRTMVFITLVLANIFLTFVNRSFRENIFKTIRYKNSLVLPVTIVSAIFLCSILLIPICRQLFALTALSLPQFLLCAATALVSVAWFELFKTDLRK